MREKERTPLTTPNLPKTMACRPKRRTSSSSAPAPPAKKARLYDAGTAVRKSFDGTMYSGIVGEAQGYDDGTILYRIVYEDGDQEDMSEGEVTRHLASPAKKIRGRPRATTEPTSTSDAATTPTPKRGGVVDAASRDAPGNRALSPPGRRRRPRPAEDRCSSW